MSVKVMVLVVTHADNAMGKSRAVCVTGVSLAVDLVSHNLQIGHHGEQSMGCIEETGL